MLKQRQFGSETAFGTIPAYCKYELYMERYRHAAEFVTSNLPAIEPPQALDIGSGRGRLKVFFDNHKRMEWHGIEVQDEMTDICSDLGYQMHTHDIDRDPLPFEDETFDVVAGLHVLEHLESPEGVLREISRVTKRDGFIILGVPTKPPGIASMISSYYSIRNTINPTFGRTCNAYSVSSFKRLLNTALSAKHEIQDVRGFRLFSARKRLPLENSERYYRVNTWIGEAIPSITPEINVIVKKERGATPAAA